MASSNSVKSFVCDIKLNGSYISSFSIARSDNSAQDEVYDEIPVSRDASNKQVGLYALTIMDINISHCIGSVIHYLLVRKPILLY